MFRYIRESDVEEATMAWFEGLGYTIRNGPEIGPEAYVPERADHEQVVLVGRLERAIARLNPRLPLAAREDAVRQVLRVETPTLIQENRRLHRCLVDGVPVSTHVEGQERGATVRLVDWDDVENNDWLALHQFTVIERPGPGQPANKRRADIVVFLNGLPIAILELKNPVDENAPLANALRQIGTYKREIPTLFRHNELIVISDGLAARAGSLTAEGEWYLPWRTIGGQAEAPSADPELRVLVQGLFDRARLLHYLRHCVVYEEDSGGRVQKKIAGYHQFHATQEAVQAVVEASRPQGNRRGGVIWHTQGSGKSLTMVFFAGQIALHPAMENPTLVVITDRNDLDGQLYGTFSRCQELLRQTPEQATSRADLRRRLNRAAGGIVFTTVQKFFPDEKGSDHPMLSLRRNIVVLADEAHRSQYDFVDGYARAMREALPNASFVGFTGTPLELSDRNTREVFGDYISIYDIARAVQDGATVPIYYEGRLAQIAINERVRPYLDEDFEEITEDQEEQAREEARRRWTQLEALVGAQERVDMVARDMVQHWEARRAALKGKAMIVCMSRRIAVALYDALVKLRPAWRGTDDAHGMLKVVMTGSASDPEGWQQHVRTKERRDALADRFKDPDDPFEIVIVRDMWLTGFDAPCLHTMYVDKPMRGHGLMQAIARVNRVFRDKPGGLVVDYIGIADQLSKAVKTYSEAGGRGDTALDKSLAVRAFLEKHDICRSLIHGYDWSGWETASYERRLEVLKGALNYVLGLEDGQRRWTQAVRELSKAYALAVPDPRALALVSDVAFYQQVSSALNKPLGGGVVTGETREQAIRELLSQAVAGEGVIDILAAAGLKRPDLSVLDEAFLAQVKSMKHGNLAAELLQRLLRGELRAIGRRNVVEARKFSELLEAAVDAYHKRAITTAKLIEQLIEIAHEMKAAQARGEALGLDQNEVAFYDALADNGSAVELMGDELLCKIARELVVMLRREVTIDWTERESVKANLRVQVKRMLRKYKYPPDRQEKATEIVLQQAETLAVDLAA
ncbi:MAG: type I restriction endonuclease subunit R [Anaerolineae bacterium]